MVEPVEGRMGYKVHRTQRVEYLVSVVEKDSSPRSTTQSIEMKRSILICVVDKDTTFILSFTTKSLSNDGQKMFAPAHRNRFHD